ncbi:MAG: PadR family transcriptional regulator, partial [Clostridia bacterium]|nr:PadR family transcriptional regulator [Clostridia bacterium]
EKNGYVHSYDGDVSNGAKRVYYGLTEQGRDHLNNDKSYWEFSSFLMSSLISDTKFDPQNDEKPFDPADFRPLTRRNKASSDNEKVVIKYVYLPQGTVADDQVSEAENDENNTSLSNDQGLDERSQSDSENVESQIIEEEKSAEQDLVNDDTVAEIEDVEDDNVEEVVCERQIIEQLEDNDNDSVEQERLNNDVAEEVEASEETPSQQAEEIAEVVEEEKSQENDAPSPIYQRKQYFDENNEVNYISSFSDMFNSIPEDLPIEEEKENIEYLTMKEMVYKFQSKGINVKPYDKKDTMEFYVNRYYYSNKLHLHVSLILFAIWAVELIISHLICNRNVDNRMPAWALVLAIIAVALYPIVRYVIHLIDPTKKSPATFNTKSSLLLSLLPIITLPIVFALMAFVEFGANINDYASMERTIVLPSVLLFNVPLYFVIFALLYRTYKYHVN